MTTVTCSFLFEISTPTLHLISTLHVQNMVDAIPPQRIVPGAPPPPPLSKSQKKKRKSVKPKVADAHPAESILAISETKSAALVEKAPEEADVKIGVIAEEPIAPPEPIQDLVASKKPSPVVELLNKRIKVQTKKLVSPFLILFLVRSFAASNYFFLVFEQLHFSLRCDRAG